MSATVHMTCNLTELRDLVRDAPEFADLNQLRDDWVINQFHTMCGEEFGPARREITVMNVDVMDDDIHAVYTIAVSEPIIDDDDTVIYGDTDVDEEADEVHVAPLIVQLPGDLEGYATP